MYQEKGKKYPKRGRERHIQNSLAFRNSKKPLKKAAFVVYVIAMIRLVLTITTTWLIVNKVTLKIEY